MLRVGAGETRANVAATTTKRCEDHYISPAYIDSLFTKVENKLIFTFSFPTELTIATKVNDIFQIPYFLGTFLSFCKTAPFTYILCSHITIHVHVRNRTSIHTYTCTFVGQRKLISTRSYANTPVHVHVRTSIHTYTNTLVYHCRSTTIHSYVTTAVHKSIRTTLIHLYTRAHPGTRTSVILTHAPRPSLFVEAHDALHTFSCKMLVADRQCLRCSYKASMPR